MENTANEFVRLFRERLKYPIISVYFIILVIYNWDVLAVFFLSNKKIEDRIIYINTVFKGQTLERLSCPLIKAIFVSLLAPAIMWGLDFILNRINLKRQDLRNKKNEHNWIAKNTIAKYEFEYEQARSGKNDIKDWEKKVNQLQDAHKSELEILQETNVSLKRTLETERGNKEDELLNLKSINNNLEEKIKNSISLYGYSWLNEDINLKKRSLIEIAGEYDNSATIIDIKKRLIILLQDIIQSNYIDFQYVKFSRKIDQPLLKYLREGQFIYMINEEKSSVVRLTPLGLIVYQILCQEMTKG